MQTLTQPKTKRSGQQGKDPPSERDCPFSPHRGSQGWMQWRMTSHRQMPLLFDQSTMTSVLSWRKTKELQCFMDTKQSECQNTTCQMSKQNIAFSTSNMILHNYTPMIDRIAFFDLRIVSVIASLYLEVLELKNCWNFFLANKSKHTHVTETVVL
jgi:hypothetical protein